MLDSTVMPNDSATPIDLSILNPLNVKRWEDARATAEATIRARLKEPDRALFFKRESDRPPLLSGIVTALLIVVAATSFLISAAKEIAAADIVLRGLPEVSDRLSASFISWLIVFVLALSELGVILFGLAVHDQPGRSGRLLLRAFQITCMCVALGANITITVQHPIWNALVFDWLLTLVPPVVVIGIGLVMEAQAQRAIESRAGALREYRAAESAYQIALATPEAHPEFMGVWGKCIIEQVIGRNQSHRAQLAAWLDERPALRAEIAQREYARNNWKFQPLLEISRNAAEPQKSSPEIPEISEKVSMKLATALEILRNFPDDMALSGAALVEKHGGYPSVWSKAKSKIREEQESK